MQASTGIGPGGDALVPPQMTRHRASEPETQPCSQTAAARAQARPPRDPTARGLEGAGGGGGGKGGGWRNGFLRQGLLIIA